jgi:hypothetical protein
VLELEEAKCVCSIQLVVDDLECSGQGKCDKRCFGNGSIKMGTSSFNLMVNKGNATILNCKTGEKSRLEESILRKDEFFGSDFAIELIAVIYSIFKLNIFLLFSGSSPDSCFVWLGHVDLFLVQS